MRKLPQQIIEIQGHIFKVLENIDNAVKTVHLEINHDKKVQK